MAKKCLAFAILGTALFAAQADDAQSDRTEGVFRGVLPAVQFDVSPPLRTITPLPVPRIEDRGGLLVDPSGTGDKAPVGPQDVDPIVQTEVSQNRIPGPTVSFDGPANLSGVSPPDPVGDIGPNHYVAMSNLFFEIYDRSGVSVFGPAANNTLWAGFGGACETENAGDPIVVYDQFVDRWLLTQFTSAGPEFFNCVALSTTPDPTGTYFRWAISNGTNFPDYPKYGVGEDAYYISTRDFAPGFVGVGAIALNKAELVAGDPDPTIISFFVDRSVPSNVGDGLLPMDIDGVQLPPNGSPHYFAGTMDDGGPYSAPQDALTWWEFVADFTTPANSSFTLVDTISITPFDTIFPCAGGRSCIPQPNTANRVDILSYRQRPLHRLTYRNFGSHESLVTNQSVEVGTGIAGIRWWEVRSPGNNPTIFQEGTFGPGVTDGIHRWMGSAAMDSAGNIGLAYSASDGTSTFPSLFYTGRLATDPAGTLPQGEESIIDGTGSQTGSQRWGDYSSLNVDPLDDCTFWYTNQYVPTTSGNGWRLRIGAFRFNECGTPTFTLGAVSDASQSVCVGDDATYDFNLGSIAGFDNDVTLAATGNPAPSTATFVPNPVTALPGTSTLTIGNTTGVTAGVYPIQVDGTATGSDPRSVNIELSVFDVVPDTPTLTNPPDAAVNVDFSPSFQWAGNNAEAYTIEVATDAGFTNIVFTATVNATSVAPSSALDSSTQYFWRVRSNNACGDSSDSPVFTFTTQPEFGDCPIGQNQFTVVDYDFESGEQGWTHSANVGTDTWALSNANPRSGAQHWHVDDLPTESDQLLTSPSVFLPTGSAPLTLQFWNEQQLESRTAGGCWDGGLLEISVNGGAFTQVNNAALGTDMYDGALNAGPLNGQQAWCGDPQEYLNSRVDLDAFAGSSVQFRFRISTDTSVGRPGWDIDDVRVLGCEDPDILFRNGFE